MGSQVTGNLEIKRSRGKNRVEKLKISLLLKVSEIRFVFLKYDRWTNKQCVSTVELWWSICWTVHQQRLASPKPWDHSSKDGRNCLWEEFIWGHASFRIFLRKWGRQTIGYFSSWYGVLRIAMMGNKQWWDRRDAKYGRFHLQALSLANKTIRGFYNPTTYRSNTGNTSAKIFAWMSRVRFFHLSFVESPQLN